MDKKNPRIIILTASYGNGHLQVANSLYRECLNRGFNNVNICNLYAESHPFFSELTEKLYKKSFTFGKQFYKLFYYGTDRMQHKNLLRWYYNYGFKRLTSLIQSESPDILINTFPINAVPEFRRRTGIIIPTFHVITDYCLHRLWLHDDVDRYYVSTNDLKSKILSEGVVESKVVVSGIPIRPVFSEVEDQKLLFKKYRIPSEKKLILFLAGAQGVLKNIKETCETLLQKTEYQIAVVCGNNLSLRRELVPLVEKNTERFHSYGYVERIDELYRLASVMVSKPGGITLTEATAIGTPLILYKPVPGQERENAKFFNEKGAALTVRNQEDLIDTIHSLLENREWQMSISTSLKSLHQPQSHKKIVEDVLLESERIIQSNIATTKTVNKKLGS